MNVDKSVIKAAVIGLVTLLVLRDLRLVVLFALASYLADMISVSFMPKDAFKAVLLGVVGYFLTRDFKVVLVAAVTSYATDLVVKQIK